MKISLLRTLVAALALCMAVPGQAAMAGDVGSGGEPGVQQETQDEGVWFSSTPDKLNYAAIYSSISDGSGAISFDNAGRSHIDFRIDGYTPDMFVRLQCLNAGQGGIQLSLTNQQTGDLELIKIDTDNGVWIPTEYISSSGYFTGRLYGFSEGTVSYSVSVYSSQNMNEPALATSEHQIMFIEDENYPDISISTPRISGDVNADIPFQVTVKSGKLTGLSDFYLRFWWRGEEAGYSRVWWKYLY